MTYPSYRPCPRCHATGRLRINKPRVNREDRINWLVKHFSKLDGKSMYEIFDRMRSQDLYSYKTNRYDAITALEKMIDEAAKIVSMNRHSASGPATDAG